MFFTLNQKNKKVTGVIVIGFFKNPIIMLILELTDIIGLH